MFHHCLILGKFRKQRSYQHESVMEAVMLSIENLKAELKDRYQELAVFLDDVGIPAKVPQKCMQHSIFLHAIITHTRG